MSCEECDDYIDAISAFMTILYGKENYARWLNLKHDLRFVKEAAFVKWLLDLADVYMTTVDPIVQQVISVSSMDSEERRIMCKNIHDGLRNNHHHAENRASEVCAHSHPVLKVPLEGVEEQLQPTGYKEARSKDARRQTDSKQKCEGGDDKSMISNKRNAGGKRDRSVDRTGKDKSTLKQKATSLPRLRGHVQLIPDRVLEFEVGSAVTSTTQTFEVKNMTNNSVAYNVHTMLPNKYAATPQQGILHPGGKDTISIVLQAGNRVEEKESFVVMSMPVDADQTPSDLECMWQDAHTADIMEQRLLCRERESTKVQNHVPSFTKQQRDIIRDTKNKSRKIQKAKQEQTSQDNTAKKLVKQPFRLVSNQDNALLKLTPYDILEFSSCNSGGIHEHSIILKNVTRSTVLFRVVSNHPEKFKLEPNEGVLHPTEEGRVMVALMKDAVLGQQGTSASDEVQFYVMETPEAIRLNPSQILKLWKTTPSHKIMTQTILCVEREGDNGENEEIVQQRDSDSSRPPLDANQGSVDSNNSNEQAEEPTEENNND